MDILSEVRVRRPAKYDSFLDDLIHDINDSTATIRDILLLAAGIGFKYQRSEPFADSGEKIRYGIFEKKSQAENFMIILAIAPSGAETEFSNLELERRIDNKITIFEEYACGGLSWLYEQSQILSRRASIVLQEEFESTLFGQIEKGKTSISDLLGDEAF